MEQPKKHRKDRRDGRYLYDMDPYHMILANLLPRRTASEAFIQVKIDLTRVMEYMEQKNGPDAPFKYTLFHVIAAAMAKLLVLRPYLNRFIAGRRFYQRDDVSLAFVVKRQFSDEGGEGLLFLSFNERDNLDAVAGRIVEGAKAERSGDSSSTMDAVDTLGSLPRWLLMFLIKILRILDFYGRVPYSIICGDPNYASVFITNLGSIQLDASYHHLNDWGTNSIFLSIGEKHQAIFYDEQGNGELRPAINLALTLDERIADGYYYSRSIKLFKYLLEHPELLDLPFGEEVKYDGKSPLA